MGIGLFFWALVSYVLGILVLSGNFGNLFAVVGGAACLIDLITSHFGLETKNLELGSASAISVATMAPGTA